VPARSDEANELASFDSFVRPALPAAALAGLAGDVVRAIEPHTEGDPAALLLSFLVMFGNAVGREPKLLTGGDPHPARLFAVLVGDSATGRKGTAGSQIERLFEIAEPDWFGDRIQYGIASAEAVGR
jgi:hypothetical protein